MKSILIPVDGSEHAQRAVKHAISMASSRAGVDIHIITVVPTLAPPLELPLYEAALNEPPELGAKAILNRACKLLDETGLKYSRHFEVGPVAKTIVDYAKKHDCDNIIMGTRGMRPFGTWVLGSTSNEVIHLADMPVTLVK